MQLTGLVERSELFGFKVRYSPVRNHEFSVCENALMKF